MAKEKAKKRRVRVNRVKGVASRHGESVQRRTRGCEMVGVKTLRVTRLVR